MVDRKRRAHMEDGRDAPRVIGPGLSTNRCTGLRLEESSISSRSSTPKAIGVHQPRPRLAARRAVPCGVPWRQHRPTLRRPSGVSEKMISSRGRSPSERSKPRKSHTVLEMVRNSASTRSGRHRDDRCAGGVHEDHLRLIVPVRKASDLHICVTDTWCDRSPTYGREVVVRPV